MVNGNRGEPRQMGWAVRSKRVVYPRKLRLGTVADWKEMMDRLFPQGNEVHLHRGFSGFPDAAEPGSVIVIHLRPRSHRPGPDDSRTMHYCG